MIGHSELFVFIVPNNSVHCSCSTESKELVLAKLFEFDWEQGAFQATQASMVTEIVALSSAVMMSSAFLHVEFVKALHSGTPLMMALFLKKIQIY